MKPAGSAALAQAFAERRCVCGAPAVLVWPGQEEVREAGILLCRAVPDRARCLQHGLPLRPRSLRLPRDA
jgi:hypothetical protein